MEALILILVEAIGTLLAPLVGGFFALIGSAISATFSLVFEVMSLLVGRYVGRPPATTAPSIPAATSGSTIEDKSATAATATRPVSARRRRWTRWLLVATSGLTAVVLLTLVVINLWFIDDLARWLLERQRERSGIAITAETIDGNLFTGRFQATGITVRRIDHPAGVIDLTVERLDTEIPVWNVFAKPLTVRTLTVDGVRGRYERGIPGQAPAKKKSPITVGGLAIDQQADGTISVTTGKKAKRPFVINELTITNLDVAYADHTRKRPLALPVTITRLTSAPLRSQWAVFDVLFRANASGTVDGRPFTISTTGDDLGRDTQWHVEDLPAAVLAEQIGGPFALLTGGNCDVHVVDHWRMSDDDRVIVMDWSVVLKDVKADVPEDTSALMALLAKPAVAFINAKADRVPLSFRVEIDEDRFNGAASVEAAGLWQVVSDSAAATLAKALGIDSDAVKGTSDKLLDKAKDALDKWRKRKD